MRVLITNYTFNAAAKTITFGAINPVVLEKVLGVVNKTRGVEYYNPEDPTLLGTAATNVLTIAATTTGHANGDKLEIWYESTADTAVVQITTDELPLPTGAATEVSMVSAGAKLDVIDDTLTGPVIDELVAIKNQNITSANNSGTIASNTGSTVTALAAILAKILAAPSTEAKQDTINTTIVNGVGAPNDTAATSDTASRSLIALFKRYLERFTIYLDRFPAALGQTTSAGSLPVAIASDSGLATQTTLAALLTELALKADLTESQPVKHSAVATYALSTATFTPAASATDIFIINGSASKTVRVLRLIVSGTQTTSGNVGNFALIKRSTANSGGTAVSSTLVPTDSASAAATATAQHYTANPTVGTPVGTIYNPRVTLWAPATASAIATVMDFNAQDLLNGTPVTLRGTAQGLAVNLSGTTASGSANHTITCIWTEE